jgi:2-polyprenyl-3-methyl-5-hydroxy-6-metoxy-1,4-benzoquinol methylase
LSVDNVIDAQIPGLFNDKSGAENSGQNGGDEIDLSFKWAFTNYKEFISTIARRQKSKSLLEVGGGRSPHFTEAEINQFGSRLTVNDISQSELDRAPDWVDKTCFDISGDVGEDQHGKYDLIFSRMVFEHIKNADQAYHNIYNLLSDGGICINFHPTFYAPPFVLNYFLPDTLSSKVLQFFFKHRNIDETPKFPAHYSLCYATEKNRKRIQKAGFSDVKIIPFYGHGYYQKIPIVRNISGSVSKYLERKQNRTFSSYAYTIVKK